MVRRSELTPGLFSHRLLQWRLIQTTFQERSARVNPKQIATTSASDPCSTSTLAAAPLHATRERTISTAKIGAAPGFAAAIASTLVPVPRSISASGRAWRTSAARQSCVVGCALSPKAPPASMCNTSECVQPKVATISAVSANVNMMGRMRPRIDLYPILLSFHRSRDNL